MSMTERGLRLTVSAENLATGVFDQLQVQLDGLAQAATASFDMASADAVGSTDKIDAAGKEMATGWQEDLAAIRRGTEMNVTAVIAQTDQLKAAIAEVGTTSTVAAAKSETAWSRMSTSFSTAKSHISTGMNQLKGMAMGLFGGTMLLTGMDMLVKKTADWQIQVNRIRATTGATQDAAATLNAVAGATGVAVTRLTSGLIGLNKKLETTHTMTSISSSQFAAMGINLTTAQQKMLPLATTTGSVNKELSMLGITLDSQQQKMIAQTTTLSASGKALAQYGINVRQYMGASTTDQINMLADAYQNAGNKSQFLMSVFGPRGAQLAPLLARWQDLSKAAGSVHWPQMTPEEMNQLQITQMQWQALELELGQKVLPIFERVSHSFITFFDDLDSGKGVLSSFLDLLHKAGPLGEAIAAIYGIKVASALVNVGRGAASAIGGVAGLIGRLAGGGGLAAAGGEAATGLAGAEAGAVGLGGALGPVGLGLVVLTGSAIALTHAAIEGRNRINDDEAAIRQMGSSSAQAKPAVDDLKKAIDAEAGAGKAAAFQTKSFAGAVTAADAAHRKYEKTLTGSTSVTKQFDQVMTTAHQVTQTQQDKIAALMGGYVSLGGRLDEGKVKMIQNLLVYGDTTDAVKLLNTWINKLPTMHTTHFQSNVNDQINQVAILNRNLQHLNGLVVHYDIYGAQHGGRPAPPTATGGYFTKPQVRLIAEAGPEWVIPDSEVRGKHTALPLGGMGGGTEIHIHLDVHDNITRSPDELADLISKRLNQKMIDEAKLHKNFLR